MKQFNFDEIDKLCLQIEQEHHDILVTFNSSQLIIQCLRISYPIPQDEGRYLFAGIYSFDDNLKKFCNRRMLMHTNSGLIQALSGFNVPEVLRGIERLFIDTNLMIEQ